MWEMQDVLQKGMDRLNSRKVRTERDRILGPEGGMENGRWEMTVKKRRGAREGKEGKDCRKITKQEGKEKKKNGRSPLYVVSSACKGRVSKEREEVGKGKVGDRYKGRK